ncbi:hypothetical protein NM688_g6679 [Phlebia brevispora]|uniref:Uncharacterized protein n=1 Tax=Phlebia brevispora TaxID=194682 RepID=A0ACC1SDX7_9APHY|nr:hypothetical protein NM688_g6679 [Phlebia brevispora]
MPKASSPSENNAQHNAPVKNSAPSLKRYQACHQCRKRKLKCDAKRPCCSTCTRSHAYAVSHAVEGTVLPEQPECTYDEGANVALIMAPDISLTDLIDAVPVFDSESGNSVSRKLYEKMESKIGEFCRSFSPSIRVLTFSAGELETLLRDREREIESLRKSATVNQIVPTLDGKHIDDLNTDFGPLPKFNGSLDGSSPSLGTAENGMYGKFPGRSPGSSNSGDLPPYPTGPSSGGLNGVNLLGDDIGQPLSNNQSISSMLFDDFNIGLRAWPPNLPSPEITRHLVEAFFTYHIHANRLFHVPTFMASLELLPTDPRFPSSAILHAMCAVGSLYSAAVPPTQTFSSNVDMPYELHQGRWKKAHPRPDYYGLDDEDFPETFTEQQARFAKQLIEVGIVRADFQCLQAQIILTWWYLSQGRWTDAFLSAAHAIRCTAPCSLSTCYTTAAITHYKPPSVLAPAKSVIEDEVRRNTFWIAYAMERQQGTGNAWALSLDDMDVCQLLPLRGDHFEHGASLLVLSSKTALYLLVIQVLVLPEERQWSYAPDILYTHPEHQTDSFILYIKSSILLSRVKTFNVRFKWKYFTESGIMPTQEVDAISSADFQQLDRLVTGFRQAFPARFKSPVEGDMIDPYLYTAHTSAVLAQVLLHEPHARIGDMTCVSTRKTLAASRVIVELMYAITATNYDVTLLDLMPFMCWFMAGRVLVRFLRTAIDANQRDTIVLLQSQISYIRTVLSQAGERVPLAYRYGKMLTDTLVNMCGESFIDSIPEGLPPRGYTMPGADVHPGVPIIEQIII